MGGTLAESRVQAGHDLVLLNGRTVQVRYLANPGQRWVNTDVVYRIPGVNLYALVVVDQFTVAGVLVSPLPGYRPSALPWGKGIRCRTSSCSSQDATGGRSAGMPCRRPFVSRARSRRASASRPEAGTGLIKWVLFEYADGTSTSRLARRYGIGKGDGAAAHTRWRRHHPYPRAATLWVVLFRP